MTVPTAPGAAPVAPTAPAKPAVQTSAPPPTTPVVDTAAELAKLDNARRAIELKERSHVVNVRKFSDEKKTIGEKLSRYEQFEKLKANAKLNPEPYFKELLGENYYDRMVELRLGGGAPTADTVAAELAKIEERVEKKFQDRDAEREKASAAASKTQLEGARRQLLSEAAEFWTTNEKEYPIFKRLGDGPRISAMLAQRIEAEYNRSERRDPDTGALLMAGRILTHKEAADLLESDLLAIAEEAAAHDKYRTKLTAKLAPPKQPPPAPGGPNQQRRTLSNDLTGTTPGRTPPVSDAERRERAIAARNAALKTPQS